MEKTTSLERNLMRRNVVGDLLIKSTARYHKKVAFKFRDKKYTFEEFNETVNRCAHGLEKLGIKRGDKAAIYSHNCDQFIIYWWGLMKLGAVITPINWMLKGPEIKYIVDHSESKLFFVEDILVPIVSEIKDDLKGVQTFGFFDLNGAKVDEGWMNFKDLLSVENSTDEPEIIIEDDDPATLLHTSGTTAAPKGVLNSHTNFTSTMVHGPVNNLLVTEDVFLLAIPLFHVAGIWMFMSHCAFGATSIIEYVPDPVEILETTHKERVTRWVWPSALYVNLPNVPGFDNYDFTSLRVCQVFGATLPDEIFRIWKSKAPDMIFMNNYGQTEMTPSCTTIFGKDYDENPDSVGRAMQAVEVKIFDDDDNEVPFGEVGEIVARSPGVMLGYFKEEEKTAEVSTNGWHHTGDLGRMDEDGFLYFVDRKKDMIKTGGENVASADVETTLANYPKVADVVIVGLPHAVWAEAITAFVVPIPGEEVIEEEVIQWCKENMAVYKVPKKVVVLDEIPMNPSGKFLKKNLRKDYEDLFKD